MTNEIVPARLAIKSMMDSGYKNAAYALAELMDNSIQANANVVELLCIEKTARVNYKYKPKIDRIAVLDNGHGMSATTLQLALQFGNGTRLEQDQQIGMGKFGMGLPSASISQARKVEVWSWQNGAKSALYTYLDVGEIINGKLVSIPTPTAKDIPEEWTRIGKNFAETGTLIVWSDLDRCNWKTGAAIISNSENLIGRMYRKFLNKNRIKIRMAVFDGDNDKFTQKSEKFAKPNDPLYLMSNTSTPAPYDKEPMFEPWPSAENNEIPFPIKYKGKTHHVYIRMSMAKLKARSETESGGLAGNQEYGQHAAKNVGVSVLRAGRELELDLSWANWVERRERWWGMEVEFPPALDELFGVTNNKQYASHFAELSKADIDAIIKERNLNSIHELQEDSESDEDPSFQLLELAVLIRKNISDMQKVVFTQNRSQRRDKKIRAIGYGPEREATDSTRERQKDGHEGISDKDETKPARDREAEIRESLIESGLAPDQAAQTAEDVVKQSLKYVFNEADIDSNAFFSVQPKGGAILVTLNTSHPAYTRLVDVLEKDVSSEDDIESLQARLNNALDGLKLLLMAWARFEDEQPSPQSREKVKDSRQDWGRVAKRFLGSASN